jgi:hypothetical protein
VFQLASLTDVHWSMSGEVVLMTLIGGLGTLFGPVVGAAVIVSMQNYLADLGSWVTVAQPPSSSAAPNTRPASAAAAAPDAGCSLADYMTLPTDNYVLLPLPLGATLTRLPLSSRGESNLFALTIPRVQLFSLAVKPSIHVAVDVVSPAHPPEEPAPCVRIAAADAFVEGAWADQLGLNQ